MGILAPVMKKVNVSCDSCSLKNFFKWGIDFVFIELLVITFLFSYFSDILAPIEAVFLLYFFYIIFRSILRNGFISLYTIFLSLCFVFNFSRVFLSLIGYCNIDDVTFFTNEKIPTFNNAIVIFLSGLTFFVIDFGYYNAKSFLLPKRPLNSSHIESNILVALMIFTFPLVVYGGILELKEVIQSGYISYLQEASVNTSPTFLLCEYIFKSCFYCSFFFYLSRKQNAIRFTLYFLILFVDGLKGNRSAFLFPFVFFLFYLVKDKYIKINAKKITAFLSIGIIFFFVASSNRSLTYNNSIITSIISRIFYEQSNTYILSQYYVTDFDQIKDSHYIPFIISDILSTYSSTFSGQGLISNMHLLPTQHNMGLGSSFIVDIWDCGLLSLFIALYVGWFIKFIETNISRNRYFNVLVIIGGMSITWMARDCVFRIFFRTNVMFLMFAPLLYYLLNIFVSVLPKKKN